MGWSLGVKVLSLSVISRYTCSMKKYPYSVAKLWLDWRFMAWLVGGLAIAGVSYFWFSTHDVARLFSDRSALEAVIEQAGMLGPVVFMFLQIIQIIVAPIPGQAVALLGGYLFGGFLGAVYSTLGSLIGFTIVLLVSRHFGRPLVERFFDKKLIAKFDYLTTTAGPAVFFLIFLLPVFPDDLVCYLAGLTKIRLSTLIIVSLLGRFPSTLLTSYIGSGVAKSDIKLVIAIIIVTMIVMALAYWKRSWLELQMRRLAQK